MSETTARPIIVIKKKGGHGGHHGGAWKVAYADFVTAMMSLFIVLWLLNSTPQVKKAIAGYFNDPRGTSIHMGTDVLGSGPSVTLDKTSIEKLQEAIKKAIIKQKELDKLADQVELKMTDEGLRIELIEGKNGTFFESGSSVLNDNGKQLLGMIAGQLKPLPNHLLVEGHTDSKPFASTNGYSNWELSSDRANAARRLLQTDGVRADQISQVRGFADQALRLPNDPLDPANRRVSLIVKFEEAPAGTVGPEILSSGGAESPEGKDTKKDGAKGEGAKEKSDPAKPAATVPLVDVAPKTGKIELPSKPTGSSQPSTPSHPVEAKPTAGKIALPSKPSAASPGKLDDQLKLMKQMKQSDAASHGK